MNDSSVIDSRALAALQKAIGEDFAELVLIFIESTEDILTNLLRAFNQQDVVSFTLEAHSLKSSSANLGGLVLSKMGAELEIAGRLGQLPESEEFIKPLKETFARMTKELQQYQN
jgi:HPt (histidine-containing phosphotransfer) domain-containing protein